MKAIKLTFLADRYHLRKYGRLITNDNYFAMQYGPVPSGTKDICDLTDFLSQTEKEYASQFISKKNQYTLVSNHSVDLNVLSKSDIEALTFSWEKFGDMNEFSLSKITHEYPEWKKHEKELEFNTRFKMNLYDFLLDPDSDIEKCYVLDESEKSIRIEQLKEYMEIESLWS